jgi:HD-like signal output (HDOD) protein
MSTLDSFFATVKLPSMSEVAVALIKTLNNEEASASEVRNIIAKDPALTAKLLRLANTAQFGVSRGVGSLDDAISLVGMSKVRTLSLASCLCDTFPTLPGLDARQFWRASMACAGYAQWLAGGVGADSQQAWLTGMMLRLGELLIGQADAKTLLEIEKLPLLPGVRWEREKRLVGFSEGQVTGELARRWNFPKEIVRALQLSSDPVTEHGFSRLGAIVHLAGLLADTPDANADAIETLPQDVVGALMLDPQWMQSRFPAADSFVNVY